MLELKYLRSHFAEIKKRLQHRGEDLSDLDHFDDMDRKRRTLIQETEELKARRNQVSKDISQLKKEKQDADHLIKEMREVGDRIKAIDHELKEVEEKLNHLLLSIPNIPHESVPFGEDEDDNMLAVTGARFVILGLNQNRTGIWQQSWISLILNEQQK